MTESAATHLPAAASNAVRRSAVNDRLVPTPMPLARQTSSRAAIVGADPDLRSAVEKACELLVGLCAGSNTSAGVSELARRAGLTKSTTHRQLSIREKAGMIERDDQGYPPGPPTAHAGWSTERRSARASGEQPSSVFDRAVRRDSPHSAAVGPRRFRSAVPAETLPTPHRRGHLRVCSPGNIFRGAGNCTAPGHGCCFAATYPRRDRRIVPTHDCELEKGPG